MAAMLKPPVRMVRNVGWQQVLGFNQPDEPFWAGVRAAQYRHLEDNVPFNMAVLTLNFVLVTANMANVVPFWVLAP